MISRRSVNEFMENLQGSTEPTLVLDRVIRFRRRTRQYPFPFEDFLQILQNNTYITKVICSSQFFYGLAQTHGEQIIRHFARIPNLKILQFVAPHGHCVVDPSALADCVSQAKLERQSLGVGVIIPGFRRDFEALGRALVAGSGRLQEFLWKGHVRLRRDENQNDDNLPTPFDILLMSLGECPKLRNVCVRNTRSQHSSEALSILLQNPSIESLDLNTNHWQWVACLDPEPQISPPSPYSLRTLALDTQFLPGAEEGETVSQNRFAAFLANLCKRKDQIAPTNQLQELKLGLRSGFSDDMANEIRGRFMEAMQERSHEQYNTPFATLRRLVLEDRNEYNIPQRRSLTSKGSQYLLDVLRANKNVEIKIHLLNHELIGPERERERIFSEFAILNVLNALQAHRRLLEPACTMSDWICLFDEVQIRLEREWMENEDRRGKENTEFSVLYEIVRMNPSVWKTA